MPYLIESMPPPDAIPETSVYRDDISARLFHFFYNMLLIPAHIKRMKDIGFTWKLIEATLYIFYVPSLLVILLSDGGFLALNNILLLVGLVEITLSLYLLVKEGDIGKNMHGKDPLKERK